MTKKEFILKWQIWIHAQGIPQFRRELDGLIKSEIHRHARSIANAAKNNSKKNAS